MDFHALNQPGGTYPFPPGPNGPHGSSRGLLGGWAGGSWGGPGIGSSSPSGFGNVHPNGYLGKDWGHKQRKDATEAEKDESKQEGKIVLGQSTYVWVGTKALGLVEKRYELDAPKPVGKPDYTTSNSATLFNQMFLAQKYFGAALPGIAIASSMMKFETPVQKFQSKWIQT